MKANPETFRSGVRNTRAGSTASRRGKPMNIRKRLLRAPAAGYIAVGFCALAMADAQAANVVFYPNADISATPYVISLDGGAATFTFTDIDDTVDTYIDAVSTSGNALVDSYLGTPGLPQPFQQDILISDSDSFSAFSSPTGVLFSNGLVSIGLEFQLPDGAHFGYATVFGPEVVQYGYNPTPGAPIGTGAAAPEPTTWVMLIIGMGALGALTGLGKNRARRNALA
jgi:hypothetical protein